MRSTLKSLVRQFFMRENGAVSLYAIIITLLLFIFNAVLIDFARIMVAEREADQATKAALRSTMSAYNEDLKSYGLFGFDGDEAKAQEIFENVFTKHLEMGEGDFFQYTDTTPVEGETSVSFHEGRMLSSEETIKYQILEEMKYIAPIEIGESIIDGFLQISEAMEEASTYAKVASDIEPLVEDREENLDRVNELLTEAKGLTDDMDPWMNGSTNSEFPEVNDLNDLVTHVEQYQEIREDERDGEDDEDMDDEEREELDESIEDADTFQENVEEFLERIETRISSITSLLNEALEALEVAEVKNQEIEEKIAAGRNEARGNYAESQDARDDLSENPGQSGDYDDAMDGINDANQQLEDVVIDEEFFTELKGRISLAIQEAEADELSELSLIRPMVTESDLESSPIIWLENAIDSTQEAFNDLSTAVTRAYDMMTNDRPEMYEEEVDDGTVDDEREDADEQLDGANETLDDLLDEAEQLAGEVEMMGELIDLVSKYQGAMENAEEFNRETTDELTEDAMSIVDAIFARVGDVLLSARDEIYVNEYILTKFQHHDFSLEGSERFLLENNEVEFIMYGLSTPGANFGAAMTELFAFRFAVNFIEAFTDNDVRAFGKFMWVAALVYALKETINDMNEIQEGPIEFFAGIPFITSYKDYLRLFLFVHLEGNKIARMMGLIEKNTDVDLTKTSTYLESSSASSLDLWFLPGITDMLSRTEVLDGRVQNNRYKIQKDLIYSY
ncbi:DUF5702 domain-containing protein [Salipaludibacillus daqingensis]|uniref:DUF5702 domain-containing protein n=1 Tax=Salipaludibacillus daqingensis TaxID=3041001 RepID=UPI00247303F2|nr:DUF5702 domain-containing protein [Salipaludibacillus daqingensis]